MNSIVVMLLFILFELSFGQNLSYYCDKSQECENCTLCHEANENYCSCNFNNGYCIYEDGVYFSKEFLKYYDGCLKSNGNSTNICGNSDIELNNGETTIQISSTFSSNLLCYYNFKYLGSDNLNMSITLQRPSIRYPKFYLYLMNYKNDDINIYTYQSINTNNYELINVEAKKLSLYIDILDPYLAEGVLLKFSIKNNHQKVTNQKNSGKNKALIIGITIGVIAFVTLIIIIMIIILIRRKNHKNVDTKITHSSTYSKSKNKEIKNKMEINKEKIDKLFQNEMRKKIYKKKNDINNCNNCFICKQYFIDNSSLVIITNCNHIFHLNCLYNFAYTNIISPKCPICKLPLLGPDDKNVLKNSASSIFNGNEMKININ